MVEDKMSPCTAASYVIFNTDVPSPKRLELRARSKAIENPAPPSPYSFHCLGSLPSSENDTTYGVAPRANALPRHFAAPRKNCTFFLGPWSTRALIRPCARFIPYRISEGSFMD